MDCEDNNICEDLYYEDWEEEEVREEHQAEQLYSKYSKH